MAFRARGFWADRAGWLKVQAPGRPRHVALGEQGVERDEQIEVEAEVAGLVRRLSWSARRVADLLRKHAQALKPRIEHLAISSVIASSWNANTALNLLTTVTGLSPGQFGTRCRPCASLKRHWRRYLCHKVRIRVHRARHDDHRVRSQCRIQQLRSPKFPSAHYRHPEFQENDRRCSRPPWRKIGAKLREGVDTVRRRDDLEPLDLQK
ncbi:hypothetical protein POL25_28475 [Nannocystis sp. bb15-2]|uniref:Uncharacterized protein n=1 Tax=Nannocystis bainbridge TaxID=2995303 RepID=A0ABT5E4T9_9BACT|nr:hypothetical protein [Nannocystis bainbridge]MDC0720874.1 hypothetical protein [Nannocystis bainbridge]